MCRSEDEEFNETGYKINFINGEIGTGSRKRYLVAWQGFSFRDDTLEERSSIYPPSKLLSSMSYEAALASIHVLGEPLNDLREAIARRLTSKVIGERVPAWQLPLEVPRITYFQVAAKLFEFLAVKRKGGKRSTS